MTARITETDLVVPSLRLAASKPNGFITTADLIIELEELFQPSGIDAAILEGRSDTHFSQKVRNLISHRSGPTSFISRGYAEYDDARKGIRITDAGRALLRDLGG